MFSEIQLLYFGYCPSGHSVLNRVRHEVLCFYETECVIFCVVNLNDVLLVHMQQCMSTGSMLRTDSSIFLMMLNSPRH
jgi:hypothetical protein